VELPINIVVVGNYHQLAVFLSRIAEMSRIVTLHDFEIAPASRDIKGTSKAKSDALVMKITAKIYRYRIL
jgi:type IV pilus assembly protein PilO